MWPYIMMRTQISLSDDQREALDRAAARTGRSMSALIHDAIDAQYGPADDAEHDLAAMRRARGAWQDRDLGIAATAMLADCHLLTRNVKHFPMFPDLRAPY